MTKDWRAHALHVIGAAEKIKRRASSKVFVDIKKRKRSSIRGKEEMTCGDYETLSYE